MAASKMSCNCGRCSSTSTAACRRSLTAASRMSCSSGRCSSSSTAACQVMGVTDLLLWTAEYQKKKKAPKMHVFRNRVHNSHSSHPRLLITAPIKSLYATSYWSSTVTLLLSCPMSEILQVFHWEQQPHPYFIRILGCSPWTKLPMFGLRGVKTLS